MFSKSWTCLPIEKIIRVFQIVDMPPNSFTCVQVRGRTCYKYLVSCNVNPNNDSVSSLHHNFHRNQIESSTVYGPSSTIGVLLKIDLPWTKTYLLWHDTVDDEKSRKESRIEINKLNKTFLRIGHKTKIV